LTGTKFQIDGTMTNEGVEKTAISFNVSIYFKFVKVISPTSDAHVHNQPIDLHPV